MSFKLYLFRFWCDRILAGNSNEHSIQIFWIYLHFWQYDCILYCTMPPKQKRRQKRWLEKFSNKGHHSEQPHGQNAVSWWRCVSGSWGLGTLQLNGWVSTCALCSVWKTAAITPKTSWQQINSCPNGWHSSKTRVAILWWTHMLMTARSSTIVQPMICCMMMCIIGVMWDKTQRPSKPLGITLNGSLECLRNEFIRWSVSGSSWTI